MTGTFLKRRKNKVNRNHISKHKIHDQQPHAVEHVVVSEFEHELMKFSRIFLDVDVDIYS